MSKNEWKRMTIDSINRQYAKFFLWVYFDCFKNNSDRYLFKILHIQSYIWSFEEIERYNNNEYNFLQYVTVIKICQAISNKLSKYYSKTKDSNEIMYNLVNILDFMQKLSFYKAWNENNDQNEKNTINYEIKYKKKFKIFFQHHYNSINYQKEITHNADQTEKIIQFNNTIAYSLLMYAQSVFIIQYFIHWQFQKLSSTVTEINWYFCTDIIMKNNSVWDYWKDNVSNFSRLTLMIKNVLLCFISFINIERVFSLARKICRWIKP